MFSKELLKGTLKPILHSLMKEGVLETEAVKVGGRTRKYYSISEKGQSKVTAAVGELNEFVHTIQDILHPQTDPNHVPT